MSARSAFVFTIIEWIFDAVQLELEKGHSSSNGTEERLWHHLINATAFQEVDQRSWGRSEQALVKWAATAFAWVAGVRNYCGAWVRSVEDAHPDSDAVASQLTFEELVEGVATLRDRAEKAEYTLKNLKTKKEGIEEQLQESHHSHISDSNDPNEPGVVPLEEGEIEEGDDIVRDIQWEYFKEVKACVSSLGSEASRKEQLHQYRELERRIASSTPASPHLGVAPEEIEKIVATSMKDVRRESERVLAEIEDELLCFKAREYARQWRTLEYANEMILGLVWHASDLEKQ